MKKHKRTPVSKYGFPRKVKIVNAKPGRPRKKPRTTVVKKVEFDQFTTWAATPGPLREPKYQKDLAKQLGVPEVRLTYWKRRQDFWEEVASKRLEWARDKTSDVIHGLYRKAKTRGEAAEVRLWMQLIEDWSEKKGPETQNITIIGIQGVGSDELKNLTKPLEEKGIKEVEQLNKS